MAPSKTLPTRPKPPLEPKLWRPCNRGGDRYNCTMCIAVGKIPPPSEQCPERSIYGRPCLIWGEHTRHNDGYGTAWVVEPAHKITVWKEPDREEGVIYDTEAFYGMWRGECNCGHKWQYHAFGATLGSGLEHQRRGAANG